MKTRIYYILRKVSLGYSILIGILSLCVEFPLHCTQTASYYNIVSGKRIHIEELNSDKPMPLIYTNKQGKKLRTGFGIIFPILVLMPTLITFLWYKQSLKRIWLFIFAVFNIALLIWQSRLWSELGGERTGFLMGNALIHILVLYIFISVVNLLFPLVQKMLLDNSKFQDL